MYDLVGLDGNAFNVMGYTMKALKREGLGNLVDEYREKATGSDYNNLLITSMNYIDKCNEKLAERENDGKNK